MSGQDAPPPPVFVDLDASGLVPGSYPVEVGWARPRALSWGRCAIEIGSVLVRPEPAWLSSGGWDPAAEAVHGLGRETLLRDGLPVGEVCDLLDREFGGRPVVTDTRGGSVDDMWLADLYEAAVREPSGWEMAKPTADQLLFDARRAHELRADLVMGGAAPEGAAADPRGRRGRAVWRLALRDGPADRALPRRRVRRGRAARRFAEPGAHGAAGLLAKIDAASCGFRGGARDRRPACRSAGPDGRNASESVFG